MLSLLIENNTVRHVIEVVCIGINANQLVIVLDVAPKSVTMHQVDDQLIWDVDFLFVRRASDMEALNFLIVDISERIAELQVDLWITWVKIYLIDLIVIFSGLTNCEQIMSVC